MVQSTYFPSSWERPDSGRSYSPKERGTRAARLPNKATMASCPPLPKPFLWQQHFGYNWDCRAQDAKSPGASMRSRSWPPARPGQLQGVAGHPERVTSESWSKLLIRRFWRGYMGSLLRASLGLTLGILTRAHTSLNRYPDTLDANPPSTTAVYPETDSSCGSVAYRNLCERRSKRHIGTIPLCDDSFPSCLSVMQLRWNLCMMQ